MPEIVRILCVDDEINILNAIKRQFFDQDFEIHTAMTAEEGLQVLRRVRPVHVVLSDYRMPGMNGIEFIKKVGQDWPAVVGIIISGLADAPAVNQAMEKGHLFAFIPKPWNVEEMQKIVARAATVSVARLNRLDLSPDASG